MIKKIIVLFFIFATSLFSLSWHDVYNIDLGNGILIKKYGFIVSYNTNYKVANFTAYYIKKGDLTNKSVKRLGFFYQNTNISKKYRASNWDYLFKRYDRGHLANAEDMSYSYQSERDSFDLANIVPQNSDCNRGIWKKLEIKSREIVEENGEAIIITGAILRTNCLKIGRNITVPSALYKIILLPNTNAISFVIMNMSYDKDINIDNFETRLDYLQGLVEIDFFKKFNYKIKQLEE